MVCGIFLLQLKADAVMWQHVMVLLVADTDNQHNVFVFYLEKYCHGLGCVTIFDLYLIY
jgi:hypothetical protein